MTLAASPQQYQFGGVKNETRVPVKSGQPRDRCRRTWRIIGDISASHTRSSGPGRSRSTWAICGTGRTADTSFSMGIRQAEQEGVEQHLTTFPLYNAPPGTAQHMGAYFYASPLPAEATRQAVLSFTHGDTYKPVPGYKTMVNHLHLGITARLKASGSLDGESRGDFGRQGSRARTSLETPSSTAIRYGATRAPAGSRIRPITAP